MFAVEWIDKYAIRLQLWDREQIVGQNLYIGANAKRQRSQYYSIQYSKRVIRDNNGSTVCRNAHQICRIHLQTDLHLFQQSLQDRLVFRLDDFAVKLPQLIWKEKLESGKGRL